MWNTRTNNGGVPTPLDKPANIEKITSGVYLVEASLSEWCWIHKINRHSELDCLEFLTATKIFQVEVQNTIDSVGFRDLVPSKPYESSCFMVNQASFLQSDNNALEIETTAPKNEEVKEVINEETLSQLFNSVDNGPIDEEEFCEDEVQMFHQRKSPYFLRNQQAG